MTIVKSSQLLTLLLLLLAQLLGVAGQSGRRPPRQTVAGPTNPEAASIPDPNRDDYQLVFPKSPDAELPKRPLGSWERWDYYAANFSEELSRVGMQGYRLASIALSPRLAVMKRADHQYEYAFVQIVSRRRMFPNDPEFALTFAPWAQKEFRVADYFVLYDRCLDAQSSSFGSPRYESIDCTYHSQMVLERRKDAEMMPPRWYEVVSVDPTFNKKKLETGLETELDNALERNLYPTHMLTRFQLLTQSPAELEKFPRDELEIVTGNVKKKINELAQQGYRLVLRPLFEAAVMYRKKGATVPTSYRWVGEKKLEQELPRLQQQGSIYRMSYGCWAAWGGEMIFEQPSVRDSKQREYRVLAIELRKAESVADQKPGSESVANNAVQQLERMSKEGFEVRDFFGCQTSDNKKRPSLAKILLERVKQ
jgi:hypothetical protein